jgi:dTMP kinase
MSCFITFEGIEGSGKSTQLLLLAEKLEADGRAVTVTREPGGCDIADQIRAILLDSRNRAMVPMTELLLYAAARSQHVEEVIRPALTEGRIVLCDRYADATAAYQGFGRGIDMDLIDKVNKLAAGSVCPDATILLDCPEETGLARAMSRINATAGMREERFELESLRFHEAVRNGYLFLASKEPERFIVMDGSRAIGETAAAIAQAVIPRLPAR